MHLLLCGRVTSVLNCIPLLIYNSIFSNKIQVFFSLFLIKFYVLPIYDNKVQMSLFVSITLSWYYVLTRRCHDVHTNKLDQCSKPLQRILINCNSLQKCRNAHTYTETLKMKLPPSFGTWCNIAIYLIQKQGQMVKLAKILFKLIITPNHLFINRKR